MEKNIKIICTPLTFYSNKDEDALFEWLYKIKSIKNIKGIGRELHIDVDKTKLSYDDMRDFIGIFKRYKFKDYKQLEQLCDSFNCDILSCSKPSHKNVYPKK